MALVSMARPNAHADLKAVCTGIGAELRKFLIDVLREPIPDEAVELLSQLDQPSQSPKPSEEK
jgi:Anti-sigma factor NepR